jgi:ATP-dependent DNA helicase UvrD/PcrA
MEGAIFDGLNEAQAEAVRAVRGPVCILAGAGTGKTTTITRRIANQVASGVFDAEEIFAVTFTEKAAKEMDTRIARLGVRGIRARTFHAAALAQYRRFTEESPDILSAKGQLLHAIAQKLPPPYKFMPLRDLATEIEWAKNRRLSPMRYLESLDGHESPIPPDLMHRVFLEYERKKTRAGKIDFEDLLEQTLRMLNENERVLALVRSRYRAFTVDEYQDVNLLQQGLLDAWVGERPDVCVVGDDYQSIFGFTGATPRYLLSFADRYPGCRVVRLEKNYRSSPEVLAAANRFAPSLRGSSKSLVATRRSGPAPTVRGFPTGEAEVAGIVSEIQRLNATESIPFEQMAILNRINGRSEDFEEALSKARIPFQVRDGSFLRRPAARAVLARLRHEKEGEVPATVARIVASAGYDPSMEEIAGEEATRQADLGRLLRLAEEFGGTSIEAFARDLRSRFAEEDQGRGVVLLTYHRAKGLEFDSVFLPRLEDKELPFALSKSEEDIAEERRLLYVGITRARRHLHLSWAAAREGERRSRPRPSPFLKELLPEEAAVSVPASVRRGKAEPAPDDPLFKTLRDWRLRIAREADVPAYVVFDNRTLALIAAAKPITRAALLAIPGVGPTKLDRYAQDVLQIVKSA